MPWSGTIYEIVAPLLGYVQLLLAKCIPQWLSNIFGSSKRDHFRQLNELVELSKMETTQKKENKEKRRTKKSSHTRKRRSQQVPERGTRSSETSLQGTSSSKKQSFHQSENDTGSLTISEKSTARVEPVFITQSGPLEQTRNNFDLGVNDAASSTTISKQGGISEDNEDSSWQLQRRRRKKRPSIEPVHLETMDKDEPSQDKPPSTGTQLKLLDATPSNPGNTVSQSPFPLKDCSTSNSMSVSRTLDNFNPSDLNFSAKSVTTVQTSEQTHVVHTPVISQQRKEDESYDSQLSDLDISNNEETIVVLDGKSLVSDSERLEKAQIKSSITVPNMTVDIPFTDTPEAWIQASMPKRRPEVFDGNIKSENEWQVQSRRRRRN